MRVKNLVLVIFSILLGGCTAGRAKFSFEDGRPQRLFYAKGFSISSFEEFEIVELRDPWDTTRLLQRYILVDRKVKELPPMPKGTLVRTPLERVVVYSSVHASIIEMLGAAEAIVGAAEVQYINSPICEQRIKSGQIANLGEATSPNIEKMMNIEPEAIICSPFKDAGYGPAEKIGVPIIEAADYMENHPLGRVEWITLFGKLLGKELEAKRILESTTLRYNLLRERTKRVEHRPRLMVEKRYGAQWFVPGGESYAAILYADAGADYIFAQEAGSGNLPLSFETVLDRAMDADVWLLKYNLAKDMSYSDLKAEYAPYANFAPYKSRNIYACNTGNRPYYEEVVMHPDWLLEDYISLFHPELLKGYTRRYFEPMAE
ncbi:MAG: ABC transporter substrate-binding protein [Rikenellaceae bacterium]